MVLIEISRADRNVSLPSIGIGRQRRLVAATEHPELAMLSRYLPRGAFVSGS